MIAVFTVGLAVAAYMLATIIWSIAYPEKRIWPPRRPTASNKVRVWLMTIIIFGSALYLGIADWNFFNWPALARWGIGLPLILVGNLVVWLGVHQIGWQATSGEADKLKTGDLYRHSRNPQYLADMGILVGWAVLSASIWALPIIIGALELLLTAPRAEETWLEEIYGEDYTAYRKTTRRYL